jgi:hypothetical protein
LRAFEEPVAGAYAGSVGRCGQKISFYPVQIVLRQVSAQVMVEIRGARRPAERLPTSPARRRHLTRKRYRGRRLRVTLRASPGARDIPMTEERLALAEIVKKAHSGDFLRLIAAPEH